MNLVSPPNTVESITSAVTTAYKMLAQNYHIDTNFVEGTTAQSGVALKLRNQELQDDRVSDVVKWQGIEKEIFEMEKLLMAVDMGQDAGELEQVDFQETTEVLSEKEQRDRWTWELSTGLIDRADILMQQNPDRFPDRESAEDYLFERSGADIAEEDEQPEQTPQNTLLEQLTRPV
jgi:hypothetical protein